MKRGMTEQKFKQILQKHRDDLLRELGPGARPWDINNGQCEEFMLRVKREVSDAEEEFDDDVGHMWISWHGRHYDAEAIDGVTAPEHLSIFRNRSKSSK